MTAGTQDRTAEARALAAEAPTGIPVFDLADLIFSYGVTDDADEAMLLAIEVHPELTEADRMAALEEACK